MLQKLWVQGVGWDDLLPPIAEKKWLERQPDLTNLTSVELPRCIVPTEQIKKVQLQLFTDASEVAYAAVIYT